jgi:hypothetical protein
MLINGWIACKKIIMKGIGINHYRAIGVQEKVIENKKIKVRSTANINIDDFWLVSHTVSGNCQAVI